MAECGGPIQSVIRREDRTVLRSRDHNAAMARNTRNAPVRAPRTGRASNGRYLLNAMVARLGRRAGADIRRKD